MRLNELSKMIFSWALVGQLASFSCDAFAVIAAKSTVLLRADNALNRLRIDPKGRFLAYIGDNGLGLSVLDLKTKNIFQVTDAQVGASFVWSPDGFRLFYREQVLDAVGNLKTMVKAFDCALVQSVLLDEMATASGFLSLDPRDLRLQLLSPKGVRTKRIYFPGERLARWQVAQRIELGKWLATQHGMLWLTQGGFAMRRVEDDGSGIESFDISPTGDSVVWATNQGRVYLSQNGKPATMIANGRDPRWHPDQPKIVFAGARMVGNKIIGYDLRLADMQGAGPFLNATQYSDERWPQWQPKSDRIIYTIDKTTDAYLMDVTP
ncbi:MAG: hypothetical protein NTY08_03795 [Proteobacteria bacterium]|nr:hypothetical protein [Pseudomonadota bacterium]